VISNADGAKQSFYSMSVDGLLPKFFSDLHATNRTPYKTNLLLWYSLVYLGFPVSDLGHMVSIGTLFAFSLVCIGVIVMRKPRCRKRFQSAFCSCIPYCRCYYLSNFDGWHLLKVGRLAI
jgi:APA family basic amino acid/polyamine antiporter